MPVLSNDALPGNGNSGNFGADIGGALRSGVLGAVGLSQASGRVDVAGMFQYSARTVGPSAVLFYPNASSDWRVRLSLPKANKYFYNDTTNSLLSPLISEVSGGAADNAAALIGDAAGLNGDKRVGVVFPYTPSLSMTHTANYSTTRLVHNNYTHYSYENSEVGAITLSGEFTVQNIPEGQYLLACIHFFRSVTKMFFGQDVNAGDPPPILYLNGYGQYYLPNVPVVVQSFQHTMPDSVDYMDIPEPMVTKGGANPQYTNYRLNSTRLPTTSTITLSLLPMYSRYSQSQGFSLQEFSRGALINSLSTGIPASSFAASQLLSEGSKITNTVAPLGGFI